MNETKENMAFEGVLITEMTKPALIKALVRMCKSADSDRRRHMHDLGVWSDIATSRTSPSLLSGWPMFLCCAVLFFALGWGGALLAHGL